MGLQALITAHYLGASILLVNTTAASSAVVLQTNGVKH